MKFSLFLIFCLILAASAFAVEAEDHDSIANINVRDENTEDLNSEEGVEEKNYMLPEENSEVDDEALDHTVRLGDESLSKSDGDETENENEDLESTGTKSYYKPNKCRKKICKKVRKCNYYNCNCGYKKYRCGYYNYPYSKYPHYKYKGKYYKYPKYCTKYVCKKCKKCYYDTKCYYDYGKKYCGYHY